MADSRAGVLPVASISRRDAVVREIRRAIVTGALKPGDKLTEIHLASSLDVSRPTVREALNQLASEGLLIQEPYRGLRVAILDPDAILDIAETRMALDMQAVRAILADNSGERLERVKAAWTAYERVAFDPDPFVQHEGHVAFHQSIWAASDNMMLLRLWPVVEAHITIAVAQDQVTRSDPDRAYAVHQRLIEAMLSGSEQDIEAAFRSHTIDSAHELIALLRNEGASV
jgi:DNA-binding GntR family transcriptional regulator